MVRFCLEGCALPAERIHVFLLPLSPRVDWASQLCFINLHPLIENSPDEERYSGAVPGIRHSLSAKVPLWPDGTFHHVQALHANQSMVSVRDDWKKANEREIKEWEGIRDSIVGVFSVIQCLCVNKVRKHYAHCMCKYKNMFIHVLLCIRHHVGWCPPKKNLWQDYS